MPVAADLFTPIRAMQATEIQPHYSPFQQKVLAELRRQVEANIRYRDTYYRRGEPPPNIGVCTDVILRAYRAAGVDLQAEVTADIRAHRNKYPLSRPDPNIDHRRCRNLIVFFRRHALTLPAEGAKADWQPGDVVFWDTGNRGTVDHIGMTAGERDGNGDLAVVHHWPGLPVMEISGLHGWTIRGHFRWPQAKSDAGKF